MGIVDKVFLMSVFVWLMLIVADIAYRRVEVSDPMEVALIHLLPVVLLIFLFYLSLQSSNLLYIAFGIAMFMSQLIIYFVASREEKPNVGSCARPS